jgi:DUF1365 family protein
MNVSALYLGFVSHHRFAPRAHSLRYAMFQILLDLDELDAVAGRLRWFSRGRFNLLSFHDADHGDGRAGPLKDYVVETIAKAGIDLAGGGGVQVLCMPRMLGFAFNPLSIYFCRRADGALAAMLYEVTNTFGQRHSYLIPVEHRQSGPIRQSCAKAFHVSPFMDMAMTYQFHLCEPGETLTTTIEGAGQDGARLITATFAGRRQPITDGAVIGALFAYPLLTLKVVAAIHWEAVKLIFKGLRLRPEPAAPAEQVTVVAPSERPFGARRPCPSHA